LDYLVSGGNKIGIVEFFFQVHCVLSEHNYVSLPFLICFIMTIHYQSSSDPLINFLNRALHPKMRDFIARFHPEAQHHHPFRPPQYPSCK
jgi:hypothetical protein